MGSNLFGKDFNPDNADINVPGEGDGPFKRLEVCTLTGIPCDRVPRCLQWEKTHQGTVDCHMEKMQSDYADPLEMLIQKEEGSFIELDEESEPEIKIGEIGNLGYMDEVLKNLEGFTKEMPEISDIRIFDIQPKRLSMRKCAIR